MTLGVLLILLSTDYKLREEQHSYLGELEFIIQLLTESLVLSLGFPEPFFTSHTCHKFFFVLYLYILSLSQAS